MGLQRWAGVEADHEELVLGEIPIVEGAVDFRRGASGKGLPVGRFVLQWRVGENELVGRVFGPVL